MSVSTHGLRLKRGSHTLRLAVELLSSMRFSISLLTVICIASVIGTVLKQNEPSGNYVNQFGPFWAEVFGAASLYSVYSAWWFLLILAFLVISTSLCVARNTPKIFADWHVYKEGIRAKSLKAFAHSAQATLQETPQAAAQRMGQMLAGGGWKVKLQERTNGWMVAAKAGRANKLGYIAAHSAIVLVCIGGLLDGDLIVRAQMLLNGKTAYSGGGLISDVKPEHRLSPGNPTFRANILVAEGAQSSTAILNQGNGVLIQDLPFSIELKKFVVEHYSTGMPKLFASDIVIHDKTTGALTPARVEVNHPVNYDGVEIYQSSFDDGGSTVKLKAVPMTAATKPFEIEGVIGNSAQLAKGGTQAVDGNTKTVTDGEKLTLEFTALRVLNVENFGKEGAGPNGSAVDVRKVDLRESINSRMGAANKIKTTKELRNVGPSITYKLRDASGQAKEFHNYMLPVDMGDGAAVYLFGTRDNPADAFRYLRIPVDDKGGLDGFLQLRAALAVPALRELAVTRYAKKAADPARPEMVNQLALSASRALSLFAGTTDAVAPATNASSSAGLQAVADFIEANVPEAERAKAGEVLVRILNGALFELTQITREQAGLTPLALNDATQAFMTQAVLSLSDATFYPAPMAFLLKDFTQVQASVFQVARAPGKKVVYTGCALLILGVFAMLYVRERRVWVWLTPTMEGIHHETHATMALSTNRKTMDGDREFGHLTEKLIGVKPDSKPTGRASNSV
ncbi:MAG: cytochrome c biogenesis protein ResB [Burkholderiaceae bacterium]|nr:cytochrome c biogenesis protein ResB [Burkholderiaceae bacterium]